MSVNTSRDDKMFVEIYTVSTVARATKTTDIYDDIDTIT